MQVVKQLLCCGRQAETSQEFWRATCNRAPKAGFDVRSIVGKMDMCRMDGCISHVACLWKPSRQIITLQDLLDPFCWQKITYNPFESCRVDFPLLPWHQFDSADSPRWVAALNCVLVVFGIGILIAFHQWRETNVPFIQFQFLCTVKGDKFSALASWRHEITVLVYLIFSSAEPMNSQPYPLQPVANSVANHAAPSTLNRADSIIAPTSGTHRDISPWI